MIRIESFKKLCTTSSFYRGLEYYNSGQVQNLIVSGNGIRAEVQGSYLYKVEIKINNGNITSASCSCPYDFGGFCKHIVAVLFPFSDEYKNENREKSPEPKIEEEQEKVPLKTVEDILKDASLIKLKRFLIEECQRDPTFMEHFLIYFSGTDFKKKSTMEYKEEINLLYEEVSYDGYIKYGTYPDFTRIYTRAAWYEDSKNFIEAITIYQALFEVISENMGWVDDSDGFYGDEFVETLDLYVRAINKAGFNNEIREVYINYLFEKYIRKDPDYFEQYYYLALKKLCKEKQDLMVWEKLLYPYIPRGLLGKNNWSEYFSSKQLMLMRLYLLDKLGKSQPFYELIEKLYNEDYVFCEKYVFKLYKDGKKDEAIKIAEEGLQIFKSHLTRKLRRFLNFYYKKDNPEKYKENLIFLFTSFQNWHDYEKLKRFCTEEEWQQVFLRIISAISKYCYNRKEIVIRLYIKEKLFDEAIKRLLSESSLNSLKSFYKDLADKFPEKYFSAYKKLIIPFADGQIGRKHYRDVVYFLKDMKNIKGFKKEFDDLVLEIKQRYKRRPAFQDELENL